MRLDILCIFGTTPGLVVENHFCEFTRHVIEEKENQSKRQLCREKS